MKNTQKGFIVPLLLVLVAVLLVGGGVYVYTQKKQPSQSVTENVVLPQPTPTAQTSNPQTANWKTYTNTKEGVSFQYPSEWLLKYVEQNSADDPFGAARILEEETFNHDLSVNNSFGTFYINNLVVQNKSGLVTPQEYMSYPLSVSSTKEWKHINGIPVLYTVISREDFLNVISYSIFTSQKEYRFNLYPNLVKQPTSLTSKDLDSIEKVISTFVSSNPSEKFVQFSLPSNNSQSVSGFSVSPVSGKAPLSVTTASFDVCQFNTIDWGDGSVAWSSGGAQRTCEFQNPLYDKASHTYSAPGTYTATLKSPSGSTLGTVKVVVSGS